jgi:hypothetical protein
MKPLVAFSLTALVVLLAAGCAGAPPAAEPLAQASGETTCRAMVLPGAEEETTLCGTAEQWVELERRVALIEAGVTCRWAPTPSQELCYTEAQWEQHDRQLRNQREAERMGEQARAAASAASSSMPMMQTPPNMQ